MTRPTPADIRASRNGGLKVAVFAVAAVVAMVVVYARHHHVAGLAIGIAAFFAVWLEGLPKAARARRRYGP
jgi:hypothetical protein